MLSNLIFTIQDRYADLVSTEDLNRLTEIAQYLESVKDNSLETMLQLYPDIRATASVLVSIYDANYKEIGDQYNIQIASRQIPVRNLLEEKGIKVTEKLVESVITSESTSKDLLLKMRKVQEVVAILTSLKESVDNLSFTFSLLKKGENGYEKAE